MLFNSIDFIIFFPIVLLIYFIIPDKIKYLWLLVSSYYFYMCWNAKYALLILASTVVTYLSGIMMEKVKGNTSDEHKKEIQKKWIVAGSFIINLGILFYFKYFNYSLEMAGNILSLGGVNVQMPQFDIVLPVGISFYTFQALSYTMDVYRDEIYAEKNFFRYALFVSFFPQLVAGPIERSKNLLKQLAIPQKFSYERFREGLLLMLWGFFLKIVLADRIAIFVDEIYGNYRDYAGWYLIVATVLLMIQIYVDFAGYSTIAMGSAWILGVKLMDNFNAPFFSVSLREFWTKWHISLTTWLRDYLYFLLGGSRKGKLRRHINLLIVFLVSGLWHGAKTTFIVWGGINGLYQIIGEMLMPIRNKLVKVFNLNRESFGHKLASMIGTFILLDISAVFFRAPGLRESVEIIDKIIKTNNPWVLFDGSLYACGLDIKNFWLMIVSVMLLVFADYCKHKGIVIRSAILKQDWWFRCLIIGFSVLALLLFGKWGPTFDNANYIYFQF